MHLGYDDLKSFIAACVQGDSQARRVFQEVYGPLIYHFPRKKFHLSEGDTGDFYLYVFEKDRIFKRIRAFEGRNAIQFTTYLSYYVLQNLCLEWLRLTAQLDTVPLSMPLTDLLHDADAAVTRQDILCIDDAAPDRFLTEVARQAEIMRALQQLPREKRLVLKLLALGTLDLDDDDVHLLAQHAARPLSETVAMIEEVISLVSLKTMKALVEQEKLWTIAYWIQHYQQQLTVLEERINALPRDDCAATLYRLLCNKEALQRKLLWRYRQQDKLRKKLQQNDRRPPVQELARLLNVPVGTLGSKITRAREAFRQHLATEQAKDWPYVTGQAVSFVRS